MNPYPNYTFLVLGINQGLRERKKLIQESEIYEYESKTEYYCIKVLEIFWDYFRQRIFNHLPIKAIYSDTDWECGQLDLSSIVEFVINSNKDPTDKHLLNKLKINQTLMYYIQ